LVVMVREICNELIKHAVKYINGEAIFTFIEDEEAHRARDMIKTILQVCGQFKHTYFDYKAKANLECPTNPWRIQNNALFVRLDAFLERCHDILDLTETVVQFSKLGKLEVGGTKGKTLSTSVQQIYADFEGAINAFRSVGYDIMDLEVKRFDDDFYEFRVTSKELERRLASVLNQGFEDATTIGGKFKLLDSFEGLLERPIIADELEKKQMSLISAYSEDLHSMQKLFLEKRESPPIPSNMPPTAGKCICLLLLLLPTFYLLYQLHEV
jgi:dynein heavy chain